MSEEPFRDRSAMVTICITDAGALHVQAYDTPAGIAKWLAAQAFNLLDALPQPCEVHHQGNDPILFPDIPADDYPSYSQDGDDDSLR